MSSVLEGHWTAPLPTLGPEQAFVEKPATRHPAPLAAAVQGEAHALSPPPPPSSSPLG